MRSRQLLLRPSPAGCQLRSQQEQKYPAYQTAATKEGDAARRQAHDMWLGIGLLPPQASRVSRRLAPSHRSYTITHTLPGGRWRRRAVLRRDASAHANRKDWQQEHHYVETKSAQPSASWLSGGYFQRQRMPLAAPGSGQPRPISLGAVLARFWLAISDVLSTQEHHLAAQQDGGGRLRTDRGLPRPFRRAAAADPSQADRDARAVRHMHTTCMLHVESQLLLLLLRLLRPLRLLLLFAPGCPYCYQVRPCQLRTPAPPRVRTGIRPDTRRPRAWCKRRLGSAAACCAGRPGSSGSTRCRARLAPGPRPFRALEHCRCARSPVWRATSRRAGSVHSVLVGLES